MAKVIVVGPDGQRSEHPLRAINTIGRHPEQNVQLLDRVVSKAHALITLREGGYWLRDNGSRNGSFVNGVQIEGPTPLADQDVITLGGTQVIFVSEEASITARDLFRHVTICDEQTTETAIRSRVRPAAPQDAKFRPESEVSDMAALRADYEKLRITFELNQDLGSELDMERLLSRILEKAFEFTHADRGAILLLDELGQPVPRAVLDRRGRDEQLEISQTILNEVTAKHCAVLSSDATVDARFGGAHSIILQGIRSTMCVPLLSRGELLGMIHLDTRIATGVFTEKDLQILTVFAQQAAVKLANARLVQQAEREAIARANLSRLLSPNLVEEVVSGRISVEKGGAERHATVLFADIRGFTSLSERLGAPEMVSMLNEYFEIMVDIVFAHDGTLDKFIGDEIMAVWGAPVAQTDHAERACRAALEMMRALDDFNRFRDFPIHVGCGINCGSLVAGYMGSSRTLSYTVVGDVVNTASRLCSVAKAGEIIVSDPMVEALGARLTVERREPAKLKGKAQRVPIYRALTFS